MDRIQGTWLFISDQNYVLNTHVLLMILGYRISPLSLNRSHAIYFVIHI